MFCADQESGMSLVVGCTRVPAKQSRPSAVATSHHVINVAEVHNQCVKSSLNSDIFQPYPHHHEFSPGPVLDSVRELVSQPGNLVPLCSSCHAKETAATSRTAKPICARDAWRRRSLRSDGSKAPHGELRLRARGNDCRRVVRTLLVTLLVTSSDEPRAHAARAG